MSGSRSPKSEADSSAIRPKYGYAFIGTALTILVVLFWAYSSHFDNPFAFDDDHTIVKNSSLDTLNIGAFLTDPSTFSTLPANQAWRPGMTITNSIDTILSGGSPDPKVFHIHIFLVFIALGVLLYLFFLHILGLCFPDTTWVNWIALFATGLFMLHTANAETINYVSARSDSQSTFFILLAFVLFIYWKPARKYFVYLIPIIYGFLIKETALMFAPLLLVYVLIFAPKEKGQKNLRTGIIASFLLAIILFIISRKMTLPTWTSGGADPIHYLATQTFVIVHYLYTFFLPVNLSVDTDWAYYSNLFDTRVFAGLTIIGVLLYVLIKCWSKRETKGIAFGIAWFFIALAPTSSIFPFAEVMNDHRIFFPYIGLVLAVANVAALILKQYERSHIHNNLKWGVAGVAGCILLGHAAGVHQRCEVWGSGETLWKDATEKSPENGRAWMNYGLSLLDRGSVDSAITMFEHALIWAPGYTYLHINMGIALSRKGENEKAEGYYKYALDHDAGNPESYYYYSDFLLRNQRYAEAIQLLKTGHEKSPGHSGINSMLAFYGGGQFTSPVEAAQNQVKQNPVPDNYLNLSLQYYLVGDYRQSVTAAEEALKLDPEYGLAYNNICAAYNKLGEYEKAIEAGGKAVSLMPGDERSKNNLAEAQRQQQVIIPLLAATQTNPTADNWINLSLAWYNAGNYEKSREAAQKSVETDPKNAIGWNNICAACIQLKDKQCAVDAATKALEIDPKMELARNNLAAANLLK